MSSQSVSKSFCYDPKTSQKSEAQFNIDKKWELFSLNQLLKDSNGKLTQENKIIKEELEKLQLKYEGLTGCMNELVDEFDELVDERDELKRERDELKRDKEIQKLGGLKLCYKN
jgi:chromosome segregation ATPase